MAETEIEMPFFPCKTLPRRTFEERVSGDWDVEKSGAGQMAPDMCGRYDTACFDFFFFFLSRLKCGGDLNKPLGASPPFPLSFPLADF